MPLVLVINVGEAFPDGQDVDKERLRAKIREIDLRLGGLPLGYALFDVGEMFAIDDEGLGPAPVSQGAAPLSLAGRQVYRHRPKPIELGESLTLRDSLHCGVALQKVDAASCVLSVEPHVDPRVGVLDGFTCLIERYGGAGPVTVTSSLQNQHEAGHTTVSNAGVATLRVDVARGVWCLHGKTEV